jgi:hypothetical protein
VHHTQVTLYMSTVVAPTARPYAACCTLQSPCQLLVSGLVVDVPHLASPSIGWRSNDLPAHLKSDWCVRTQRRWILRKALLLVSFWPSSAAHPLIYCGSTVFRGCARASLTFACGDTTIPNLTTDTLSPTGFFTLPAICTNVLRGASSMCECWLHLYTPHYPLPPLSRSLARFPVLVVPYFFSVLDAHF